VKHFLVAFQLLDQQMQAFLAEPVGRARAQVPVVTDHGIQFLTLPAHSPALANARTTALLQTAFRGGRAAALQSADAKSAMLHHAAVTRERARFTRRALGEAMQRACRFQIVEIRPY
jgi:hypothetical protein